MNIIDISVAISKDIPVWPGNKGPKLRQISNIAEGAACNETHLEMNAHAGTHIDAPLHFIADGSSIDKISPGIFVGPVYVVDLTGVNEITAHSLESAAIPDTTERILCKTKNSALWDSPVFDKNYVGLTPDAALWLVEKGVKLIGNDYLSVAAFEDAVSVHTTLLKEGIGVLEGIDLSNVDEGAYQLFCLPVKIEGAEAAPARAVLIRE